MYILFNGNRCSLITNDIEFLTDNDWLVIKNNNVRLNSNNKKHLAIAYFDKYDTHSLSQQFAICNKGEEIYSDFIYYWEYRKKINISEIKELQPYMYIEISIELYPMKYLDDENIPEYFLVFTIY